MRPVREQLEHDRVIRLLQAKYKRKFEVGINPGPSLAVPVGTGDAVMYPDLVLQSTERSRKLMGVVEVETAESVNHLEAMSQWVRLGRLKVELHLYVPSTAIDTTRRLCTDFSVPVDEIWTYHPVGDEIRFTLVQSSTTTHPPAPKSARVATEKKPVKPAVKAAAKPAVKPVAARAAAKPAGMKFLPAKGKAKPAAGKASLSKATKPAKAAAPKRPAAKTAPARKRG
ncbi:MAG: hypothetical protein ABL971_07480 [Vicinamibacterales bacterium]